MLAAASMPETMNGTPTAEDARNDLTGTSFAGREIDTVIGEDLVSSVYRAKDVDDGHVVALRLVSKDLHASDGPEGELYQRFHQHARAALTFRHPYAPAIHEVGEHLGRGYLVTAHVETVSFGKYIDAHGPLDLDTVLQLFAQIADVLDAGLRAGVTHGAVNPSTLRIATSEDVDDLPTAYLTGHGLGDLLELRLRRDRNQLDVVDDLLYVAPEQLRQQPTTGRTDQYAMACALVHALTGAPPFVRDSVGGLFGAHLFVAPPHDPASAASAAITKGLAKEPRSRFATCGQLIAEVERAHRSAANRRSAADRRRRLAAASGNLGAEDNNLGAEDGDEIRMAPSSQSLVVDLDELHPVAPVDDEVEAAPTGTTSRVVVVDLTRGPDADAPATDAAGASPPAARPEPETQSEDLRITPDPSQPGATDDVHPTSGSDDVDHTPLSDVLQHRRHPATRAQRVTWSPSGAWVAGAIALVVLAAAALWFIGS
jgi:hypothetical protein